jgi:hypothetical protein
MATPGVLERAGVRPQALDLSGPARVNVHMALAFTYVNRFSMALLYGRAGRLTAINGGFRPRAVIEKAHLASMEEQDSTSVASVRTLLGRLRALSILHNKSSCYGAFVWARRALNRPKWVWGKWAEKGQVALDWYTKWHRKIEAGWGQPRAGRV